MSRGNTPAPVLPNKLQKKVHPEQVVRLHQSKASDILALCVVAQMISQTNKLQE